MTEAFSSAATAEIAVNVDDACGVVAVVDAKMWPVVGVVVVLDAVVVAAAAAAGVELLLSNELEQFKGVDELEEQAETAEIICVNEVLECSINEAAW